MNFSKKMVSLENDAKRIEEKKVDLVDAAKTALHYRKIKISEIADKLSNFVYKVQRFADSIILKAKVRSEKKTQVSIEAVADLDKFIEKYDI